MAGTFEEQIQAAVGAHGMWKARLRDAIETGKSDFVVDTVKRDDVCDFGRWLKSAGHAGADHEKVRQLHASFHSEAAKVLQLATTGKKPDAIASMAFGGTFSKTSSALVVALKGWQKAA
jgi:Chemoreceptor zinc-binding domain